jgi:hypothetical protein
MSARAPAGPRAPALPSPPRAPAPARLRGAPRLPRVSGAPQKQPWEVAPAWFRARYPAAPITEWACIWALTTVYKFRPPFGLGGRPGARADFLYQPILPIPGLNQSNANRADLWLLPGSPAIIVPPYNRGLILNPRSEFTHPDHAKDRMERALLGQYGYQEIYLDEAPLMHDPQYLVGQAIRGIDLSAVRG